jgi:hopanoid-associated phosphorylase
MAVAAVTGLAAEARIARRAGIAALAAGGDAARTAAICAQLLAEGAALVSFGIAGALAPGLAPGTLLLPRRVLDEAGAAIAVDAGWHARVRDHLRTLGLVAVDGDIIGAAGIVASPGEKAALHRRTAAVAVDLESHIAAAAAHRLGRAFLVLRAVADPAAFALPPAAAVGIEAHGHVAILAVLSSILRRPGQVGDLVRLARYTRRALAMLKRSAPALGASL